MPTGTGVDLPKLIPGQRSWSMVKTLKNHREIRTYTIRHLVRCGRGDGPFEVSRTPGLPRPCDIWHFDNDYDPEAYCTYDVKYTSRTDDGENKVFEVENTFTNEPPEFDNLGPCMTGLGWNDYLLEPADIKISFVKFTEEATSNRYGNPILNSAHEPFRGPQVEFDKSRIRVSISQNIQYLQLDKLNRFINHVNSDTLWGFPARTIKLSDVTADRKLAVLGSSGVPGTATGTFDDFVVYYRRTLIFEIYQIPSLLESNHDSGWDRDLLDEGTKVLEGQWNSITGNYDVVPLDKFGGVMPDPSNPKHFKKYVDRANTPCRVMLNGAGLPADATSSGTAIPVAAYRRVEYYREADFLELCIPGDIRGALCASQVECCANQGTS